MRTQLQTVLDALTYAGACSATRKEKAIAIVRGMMQAEPVAYWIPKAEQFCLADKSGRPFAKAWEPLFAAPQAVPAQATLNAFEVEAALVAQSKEFMGSR